MRRIVLRRSLALVTILIAVSADISRADVLMTQHGKRVGYPSEKWTRTLRIKGLRMRVDGTKNGNEFIIIYDLNSGKAYQLYPKHKEAIVVDLKLASATPNGRLPDEFRRSIKETGNKKDIGGVNCNEYKLDFQVSVAKPRHLGDEVLNTNGTFCVSQTTPEGVEVANFVQEAMKRGYGVATSLLSPTQSSFGSYLFDQEPNMLVVGSTIETRIKTTFVQGKSEFMGTATDTLTTSEIKSESISDEYFQIPNDWKQKQSTYFR